MGCSSRVIAEALVVPQQGNNGGDREFRKMPLTGLDMCMIKLGNHKRTLVFKDVDELDLEEASLKLRESLSRVLSKWYPFAGRLVLEEDGTYAIDCNDAGVPVVDAVGPFSQCHMSGVNNMDIAMNFCRDLPFGFDRPESFASSPLFAAQITKFDDGPGFVIGITFVHGVADGTSIWQFMNAWASLARGELEFLLPDLASRAHVTNFTPHSNSAASTHINLPHSMKRISLIEKPKMRERPKNPTQFLHLTLDEDNLSKLKSKICEETGSGSIFSSYELVTTLLWRAIIRARNLCETQDIRFLNAVNCRRLCKNLGESYFGNAALQAVSTTTAGELLNNGLSFGANLTQQTLKDFTGEIIQDLSNMMEREKTKFLFLNHARPGVDVATAGSRHSPSFECDFGWGPPSCMKPAMLRARNGLLAWMPKWGSDTLELVFKAVPVVVDRMLADEELNTYASLKASQIFTSDGIVYTGEAIAGHG